MKILGIDPGYGRCGFGIIEQSGRQSKAITFGCIETSSREEFIKRLSVLSDELHRLIDLHQPDLMAVEELFFAKNTTTALKVAHARGVILLTASQRNMKLLEFKPNHIKQALTGHGAADKQQMQQMIKLLLGLKSLPKPDDAADALAIALTAASWKSVIRA